MQKDTLKQSFFLEGPGSTRLKWSRTSPLHDPASPELPSSVHDHFEIYIHVFGDDSMCLEGRVYLLSPGDVVIIPPYTIHRHIRCGTDYSTHYSIRVPAGVSREYFACLYRENELLCLSPDTSARSRISSLCHEIDKLERRQSTPAERLALFSSLLMYFERTQAAGLTISPTPLSDMMQRVCAYVSDRLSGPLNVTQLCHAAGTSRNVLSRTFSRELGLSPYAYVQQMRLSRARALLLNGSDIAKAAADCGFKDYSHFIACFRSAFGVTPGRYLQLQQDRQT